MLEQFKQIRGLKLKVTTALDLAQAVAHLHGDVRVQQAIDAGRLVLANPSDENKRRAAEAANCYDYDACQAAANRDTYAYAVAACHATYSAWVYAVGYSVSKYDGVTIQTYCAARESYNAAKGDKELTNKLDRIIKKAFYRL